MSDQKQQNHERYVELMGQLKLRLRYLEADAHRLTAAPALPTNEATLLYERVCLQLRKVLELIAFSSLVANQERFAVSHPNFAGYQRAKNVLKSLRTMNPRYYPAAKRQTIRNSGQHFEDAEPDTWLSEEEFALLFDACSEALHVTNPYNETATSDLGRSIPEWIARIRALLQIHVAALNDDDIVVVFMEDWNATNVRLLSASAK
jgi:hypothetical protein